MPKTWKDWSLLIFSLLIPQAVGAFGALFTVLAIPLWYNTLTLPLFTPPSWVFGPVWTLLYILMGLSLYIVWRSRGGSIEKARARRNGLIAFSIQLVLNALWSFLFFGLHNPLLGLIDIVFLFIAIVVTARYFLRVQQTAAYLLIPYGAWVAFAGILNTFIYLLNR